MRPRHTQRDLLRLLLVKYIFSLRPHAQFRAPNAFSRPFAEGRWDDIKATYRNAISSNAEHPLPALRRLARAINEGVMRGAQRCRALQAEALGTIRAGEGAEILYLDPPYPGTLAYEQEYRILDELLGDVHNTSDFSGGDGLSVLGDLLAHCHGYPLWVISYGNAVSSLEVVTTAVRRSVPFEQSRSPMSTLPRRPLRRSGRGTGSFCCWQEKDWPDGDDRPRPHPPK